MIDISPLVKYGIIAAVILALIAGIFAAGMRLKQQEWDAAIAQQAIEAGANIIEQARNQAEAEKKFEQAKQTTAIKTKIIMKEVIRYVESPATKCLLSPEFVRSFDDLSRLLDPGAISVSPAPDSPRNDAQLPQAIITDAAVLRAYEAAIVQLAGLWDAYAALVDWTRTSHALALKGAGQPSP